MSNAKTEADSVEEYLAANPDYMLCRDDGHAWPRKLPRGYVQESGGRTPVYGKRMVCQRCGLVRVKRIQDTRGHFERIHPRYEYPDGYLATGLGIQKEDLWRYQITGTTEAPPKQRSRRASTTRRLRSAS